ncbi:MAG: AAA family ATPase, partial [bacterium]|nr:AAA family ATPase [bacterium]
MAEDHDYHMFCDRIRAHAKRFDDDAIITYLSEGIHQEQTMKKTIAGYDITEKLFESSNSLVYRALQQSNQTPVILKMLRPEHPASEALSRFRQEFDMTRSLHADGIIRVSRLEQYCNTLMIVEEDIGAESLDRWMIRRRLTIEECLSLAVRIAEHVGHIHAAHVTHKDLNPSNIIWNPRTGQMKIIDFGIAVRLPTENFALENPSQLEGTLAYSSPEQTGRINRSIDYRTDLYSLGVVLYEMLSGQLPFTASDAMELVHCHIAKKPFPVCDINADIPPIVSDIVMKLLGKDAEDRYQSAFGAKADLEKCQKHFANNHNMKDLRFELGQHDFSGQFHIPQKLYGRESEIKALLQTFERVSSGKAEAIVVAGYSGVGKTALVYEVHKPMTEKRGYFMKGKFDQFKQNIPYYAVTQAFNELCRFLLRESKQTLANWQRKILNAVGMNGQIIIDVIPDLELVIGKQPAVAAVDPTEAQNRFNLLFVNFFKALCDKDHPLVIFLDDLQWADLPTLNLIKLMMTDPDVRFLLFIGAYRDNEISAAHPLPGILESIQKQIPLSHILLPPLNLSHVNSLISDSTTSRPEQSKPLAALVYEKTGGNPFFVNMFLKAVAGKRLIEFDFERGEWTWDMQRIRSLDISDNVIDMMVDRISQLPAETQHILSLAACLGNRFNLKILSLVSGQTGSEVLTIVWEAILDGSIVPLGDDYKWIEHTPEKQHKATFRFLHDKVQQAAYSLFPGKKRAEIHVNIGRLLQNNLTAEELDENLFEVANHFNQGKELISNACEREHVARLNLKTARKAKQSSAYLPALNYMNICKEFLPADSWETQYELSLSYYFEKGEIEYLNTLWDTALATFKEVSEHVSTLLERCKISEYTATLYRMKNDLKTALDIGVAALNALGIEVNAFPDEKEVGREIERCNQLLKGKDADSLFHLPELTDPLKLQTMALLRECFAPAYFLGSHLIAIIGIRMTEITLESGNNPHASVGYIFLSSITLAVRQNDYDNAYKFGVLSLRLNDEKYHIKAYEALILDMWGTFVCPYKKSVDISRTYLMRGYYSGVENGSYQWAGYCAIVSLFQSFWGPDTLDEVEKTVERIVPGLGKIDPNMVQYYYAVKATIHNLKEPVPDWSMFSEEFWPDSRKVLKQCRIQNDPLTLFVDAICRLSLANWYHSKKANDYARQAEHYLAGAPGIFLDPVFHFHQSIAYAATYHLVDETQKEQYRNTICENIDRFEVWARHCPENYRHYLELIQAEFGRIKNAPIEEIMSYYDKAIESASENRFIQNQALAYELASRFYQNIGRTLIAQTYLKEAHRCYQQWGASVKVQNLEAQYPQLLDRKIPQDIDALTESSIVSTSLRHTRSPLLDLESVMKASQTLSGEIILSSLLKKMMHILMENAGATRGLIIFEKEGQWVIEAEGFIDVDEVTILPALPFEEDEQFPATLIHYISYTQEHVALSDATQEGGFTQDAYIIKKRPKSLLGLPLLNHGIFTGILYLENNLTTGAFTADRLQVISLLASQAGISLENARLFEEKQRYAEELTEEVAERKQAEEELRESEEKHRLLFESMARGVVYQDAAGAIIDANQSAEHLLSLTLDQMQGRTPVDPRWKAIHEDGSDFPEETHPAMVSLKKGVPVNDVIMGVFNPATEEYCWININTIPQFNPGEDTPSQVFITFDNITERKQAQDELRKHQEHLEDMVEERTIDLRKEIAERKQAEESLKKSEAGNKSTLNNLLTGVVVHAADTSILLSNPEAQSILGLSAEQITGKTAIDPAWNFVHRDLTPMNVEDYPVNKVIATQKQFRNDILGISRPDRDYVTWINVNAFPVFADNKELDKIVVNIVDITERRRVEEALQLAQKTAEIASQAKSDFLANMSHEIRTPMNTVIGMNHMLMRTKLNEKQKEYVNVVHSSSRLLLGIINDILDFSKIEAGKLELDRHNFQTAHLLSQMKSLFGTIADAQHIDLFFHVAPDFPH